MASAKEFFAPGATGDNILRSTIPAYTAYAIGRDFVHNTKDGYQLEDISNSMFGKRNDYSAKQSSFDNMSEREFADYEMREAHKLGVQADSEKYQRAYNDLKKAGLNPRLLLEGGSASANGVSASSAYSSSENKSQSSTESYSSSAIIAALFMAVGKIIAAAL